MRTYYPTVDHAVPDCSGFSGKTWGCSYQAYPNDGRQKAPPRPFPEMGDVKPGINDITKRVNQLSKILADVAGLFSGSDTSGYDWW